MRINFDDVKKTASSAAEKVQKTAQGAVQHVQESGLKESLKAAGDKIAKKAQPLKDEFIEAVNKLKK